MASTSAISRQRGNNTVEYRVVRNHFGPLVKHCQHVLSSLANELFSKELISKLEHTNAIDKNQPMYDKASIVIDSVLTKIEGDSSCFDKLMAALREAELDAVTNDLETALRQERHCPTVSSSSGLPQNVITATDMRAALSSASSINNVVTTCSKPLPAPLGYISHPFGPPESEETSSLKSDQGSNFAMSPSSNVFPLQTDDQPSIPEPSEINETKGSPERSSSVKSHSGPIGNSVAVQSPQDDSSSTDKKSSCILPCFSSPQFNTGVDGQLAHQSLRQLAPRWSGQKICSSSPVVGDKVEYCMKPRLPLASNPLIDALSSPLISPMKLILVPRFQTSSAQPSTESSPYEESGVGGSATTQSEDVSSRHKIAQEHESATSRHSMVKRGSLQSSCFCHFKIEVLRVKLNNRMTEIEILKNEIGELEKHFEEERRRMSEAIAEQTQLRAQREKVSNILEDDIASRDKLIKQLSEENAKYEREMDELKMDCTNSKEWRWIAEQKACFKADKVAATKRDAQVRCDELKKNLQESEVKSQEYRAGFEEKTRTVEELEQKMAAISGQYEDKIASLKNELAEVKLREAKTKRQYVRIGYETVKSEIVADFEACIAEKNVTARKARGPKLKLRVEREVIKATLENDFVRVKEAEELVEKTSRLLRINDKEIVPKESGRKVTEGRRQEIRALDLVTPDKDTAILSWL